MRTKILAVSAALALGTGVGGLAYAAGQQAAATTDDAPNAVVATPAATPAVAQPTSRPALTNDDGTADQGRGDAGVTRTAVDVSGQDGGGDDGTTDQGRGDNATTSSVADDRSGRSSNSGPGSTSSGSGHDGSDDRSGHDADDDNGGDDSRHGGDDDGTADQGSGDN